VIQRQDSTNIADEFRPAAVREQAFAANRSWARSTNLHAHDLVGHARLRTAPDPAKNQELLLGGAGELEREFELGPSLERRFERQGDGFTAERDVLGRNSIGNGSGCAEPGARRAQRRSPGPRSG